MTTAVPQAAGTTGGELLDALRRKHGRLYTVGFDEEHGWWAVRRGQIGPLLTAPGPGELDAAIAGDMTCGDYQLPGEIEWLRRSARAYGLAAYRACARAGDEVTAARVAGEMTALGLLEPGGRLPGREEER
jgi:hypothetical protein